MPPAGVRLDRFLRGQISRSVDFRPDGKFAKSSLLLCPGRIRAKPCTQAHRKAERRFPRRSFNLGNRSILRASATASGGPNGSPGSRKYSLFTAAFCGVRSQPHRCEATIWIATYWCFCCGRQYRLPIGARRNNRLDHFVQSQASSRQRRPLFQISDGHSALVALPLAMKRS